MDLTPPILPHGLPSWLSVKEPTCQCRSHRCGFNPWVGKIPWRRKEQPTPVPCGSAGKESACNAGDLGLIPGLGRSPGEGKGYPLQYSGLENSMDCIVHWVAKSRTRLSDFHLAPKQQNRACLACKNLKPNYLLSRTQFRKESFQAQKCMLNFPLIFLISS